MRPTIDFIQMLFRGSWGNHIYVHDLSLGNAIGPQPNFKKIVFVLYFYQIFYPNSWNPNKSLWRNQLNRIRNALKFLNEIKRDCGRKRSKRLNTLTFWLKLTFNNLIDFFDLWISFKVIFFDLLIKNWSKINQICNGRYHIDVRFWIGRILLS